MRYNSLEYGVIVCVILFRCWKFRSIRYAFFLYRYPRSACDRISSHSKYLHSKSWVQFACSSQSYAMSHFFSTFVQTRSKYVVRIDNTDEKHAVDLRPCNALPDSAYQYTVGQRLMILDTSSTSGEQTWVDATVVASFGKQHGSRHQIQAGLGGNEKALQIDLNRFNHAAQVFNTVDEFLALRTEFFNHLRETEVKVPQTHTHTHTRARTHTHTHTHTHTLPPRAFNMHTPCVDCV